MNSKETNMANLKDYRKKELSYYIIANIAVLLLLLDSFHFSQFEIQIIEIISNFIRISILSSVIYILTFIADGLFSSDLKIWLIGGHSPGEKIFSKIQNGTFDKRFTCEEAQKIYSKIYESLPKEKKDRFLYENAEWYKIYNKYRNVTMIMVSNRDFLLCRDIYFSTIINIIIYLGLTFVFKTIVFDWRYIGYLTVMLILSNLGTRNKGSRFVSNVIALDIANYNKTQKNEGE
jgi:hypothetical protein